MPTKYYRDETIGKLNEALKNDISTLYNAGCINWKGKTKTDGSEKSSYYVDVISTKLLEQLEEIKKRFNKKNNHQRGSYVMDHNGIITAFTNRSEEILAKSLYRKNIDKLGTVFDYQVPLKIPKNKNEKENEKDERLDFNKGTGKIDLVSISDDATTIYLIELKVANSSETLLRCGLEIYTYYNQLNFETFENDLKNNYKKCFEEHPEISKALEEFCKKPNRKFKKAILVFNGSIPATMANSESEDYSNTVNLIKNLGIEVFIYSEKIKYKAEAELGKCIMHIV